MVHDEHEHARDEGKEADALEHYWEHLDEETETATPAELDEDVASLSRRLHRLAREAQPRVQFRTELRRTIEAARRSEAEPTGRRGVLVRLHRGPIAAALATLAVVLGVLAALQFQPSSVEASPEAMIELCLQENGYPGFTFAGPSILRDGSTWAPDEHGRVVTSPAVLELLEDVENCRELLGLAEKPSVQVVDAPKEPSADILEARRDFLNAHQERVYACMESSGWSVPSVETDHRGRDHYFWPDRDSAAEQQWQLDRAICQSKIYGSPQFPNHLVPGLDPALLPGGEQAPPPQREAFTDWGVFLNEYHDALYSCMERDGWEVPERQRDQDGLDYYLWPERNDAEQQRWEASRDACWQELYEEPTFPHRRVPGYDASRVPNHQ